jgi:hypothetical protein
MFLAMDKIILKVFKQRCWDVAKVWKNNKEIATINRFYHIDEKWIYIYDTVGGQGTGYHKGDLVNKIYIGDCEFEKIECA